MIPYALVEDTGALTTAGESRRWRTDKDAYRHGTQGKEGGVRG